jgi:hypothetical protein
MKIKRKHLKGMRPETLRRFALWLGLKWIDGMSHRQLANLVMWLLTRHEKKLRGMTHGH